MNTTQIQGTNGPLPQVLNAPLFQDNSRQLEINTAFLKADFEEAMSLFGVKVKKVYLYKQGRYFKAPCIEYRLAVNGKERALALYASFFASYYNDYGELVGTEKNYQVYNGLPFKFYLNKPLKHFEEYAKTLDRERINYFKKLAYDIINEAMHTQQWNHQYQATNR